MQRWYAFALEKACQRETVLQSEGMSDEVCRPDGAFRQAHGLHDGAGEKRQGRTRVENGGQRLSEHEIREHQGRLIMEHVGSTRNWFRGRAQTVLMSEVSVV